MRGGVPVLKRATVKPAFSSCSARCVVADSPAADASGRAAPLGPRILAGLVDIAVLAAVDAAVVVATLRATGIEWSQVRRLPLAPLGVFLLLLTVGYLALCTVLAGRTFGKAAFGLAVVDTSGRPVRLGPAVVRLLKEPRERERLGERARALIEGNRGALRATVEALAELVA